jgi:hypothetical protein
MDDEGRLTGREIVEVVGYIRVPGVEVDEYFDFNFKRFTLLDVKLGLDNGSFPPGLVFRDKYGTIAVVDLDRRTLKRLGW